MKWDHDTLQKEHDRPSKGVKMTFKKHPYNGSAIQEMVIQMVLQCQLNPVLPLWIHKRNPKCDQMYPECDQMYPECDQIYP